MRMAFFSDSGAFVLDRLKGFHESGSDCFAFRLTNDEASKDADRTRTEEIKKKKSFHLK